MADSLVMHREARKQGFPQASREVKYKTEVFPKLVSYLIGYNIGAMPLDNPNYLVIKAESIDRVNLIDVGEIRFERDNLVLKLLEIESGLRESSKLTDFLFDNRDNRIEK